MSDILTSGGAADIRMMRLEENYKRIEMLLKRIDKRTRRTEIEIAQVKGRVSQLPSSCQMFNAIAGGQITFVALIIAVMKLFAPD